MPQHQWKDVAHGDGVNVAHGDGVNVAREPFTSAWGTTPTRPLCVPDQGAAATPVVCSSCFLPRMVPVVSSTLVIVDDRGSGPAMVGMPLSSTLFLHWVYILSSS